MTEARHVEPGDREGEAKPNRGPSGLRRSRKSGKQ